MNALVIFSTGILSGLLTIRADRIADSTGLAGDSQAWNIMLEITSLASLLAFVALMVWGFMQYQWWIPILVFLASGVISGILVNRKTFVLFSVSRPLFSLLSIIAAVWCWLI